MEVLERSKTSRNYTLSRQKSFFHEEALTSDDECDVEWPTDDEAIMFTPFPAPALPTERARILRPVLSISDAEAPAAEATVDLTTPTRPKGASGRDCPISDTDAPASHIIPPPAHAALSPHVASPRASAVEAPGRKRRNKVQKINKDKGEETIQRNRQIGPAMSRLDNDNTAAATFAHVIRRAVGC